MSVGYLDLLRQWCDGMLACQLRHPPLSAWRDALLCPACGMVHGRCFEAAYPLLCLAEQTGESRYLSTAIELQRWGERMSRPDGSWVNDEKSEWKGTTVFATIALGEALRHHGKLLDAETRRAWTDRLRRAADFLMNFREIRHKLINYPVSCAAALAVADHVLKDERYRERAGELARIGVEHITGEGLLYGESDPPEEISPKGCRAVDVLYNVEETLGNLALCADLAGEEGIAEATADSLRTHLEFMLPDGAWDDSFGTRNFKWTYWGSRTTDGCQVAMALLADRDERFAEAAWRNLQLLAACTRGGLLYGGPHLAGHGEQACIHHTFTHAKALAIAIDRRGAGWRPVRRVALPRDSAAGLRHFGGIATSLAGIGPWRATVTDYDLIHGPHVTGGTLCLLYHTAMGPVIAAGPTEFRFIEPNNMQPVRDGSYSPLGPRIEVHIAGRTYASCTDPTAHLEGHAEADRLLFRAAGRLTASDYRGLPAGDCRFRLAYELTEKHVVVQADVMPTGPLDFAELVVPIISSHEEPTRWAAIDRVEISKGAATLLVHTDAAGGFVCRKGTRIFDPSPGLEAMELRVRLSPGRSVRVTVSL